jgi:hypothetical protein
MQHGDGLGERPHDHNLPDIRAQRKHTVILQQDDRFPRRLQRESPVADFFTKAIDNSDYVKYLDAVKQGVLSERDIDVAYRQKHGSQGANHCASNVVFAHRNRLLTNWDGCRRNARGNTISDEKVLLQIARKGAQGS